MISGYLQVKAQKFQRTKSNLVCSFLSYYLLLYKAFLQEYHMNHQIYSEIHVLMNVLLKSNQLFEVPPAHQLKEMHFN